METNPLLVSSVELGDETYTLNTPLELYWSSVDTINERKETSRGFVSGTDIKKLEFWTAFDNNFGSIQSFFDSCAHNGVAYATNGEHDGIFLWGAQYELYGTSKYSNRAYLDDAFVVFTQPDDCAYAVCDHELTNGVCTKADAFEVEFEYHEIHVIN